MENKQEKSQEDMVKEAVEEAKKSAAETESAEAEAEETEETSEEAGSEEAKEDAEKKTGKKLFGKKKDKKDEKIEELTDKLTRQMAEFDNFRKRTEKEKSQMYEIGAKDIIEKILPVVDNFERGLDAVKEEEKEDPFVQGMEKVYKHLVTTLEGIEVKPIEAVGQPFDPNFHNAVMHVEDENFGENIVAEEFQKGYTYRDSVVRHIYVADDNLSVSAVYQIPKEEFESVIMKYFNIDSETLQSKTIYDSENLTYEYKPRGFEEVEYPEYPYSEVVGFTENNDGTITLTANVVFPYAGDSKVYAHEVVVRPLENGRVQYVSNRIIPSEDNYRETWHTPRLTLEEWEELYGGE